MRISSSTIGMESARSYSSETVRSAWFYMGRNRGQSSGEGNGFLGDLLSKDGETQDTDESGKSKATPQDVSLHFRALSNTDRISAMREERDSLETIRQRCMNYLFLLLFGEQRRSTFEELWGGSSSPTAMSEQTTYGYGMMYNHSESETTSFSTTGIVKTADGREISFGLNLEMSRSFTEYYEERHELGVFNYTDPLVINLNGNIAGLSDQTFYFDLDCDGEEEEISSLQSGSGFLALDLNGDGIINDGSELFGTKSGNGFADLAQYDADGNGWIDEADEIWDKLLVWAKDEEGNDKLYHLSEAGVGAICLQNANTQFSLNSMTDNHHQGMIRSTGIFLYENGGVGTVQHLDLAR